MRKARRELVICIEDDCGKEFNRPVNSVNTIRCPECQKKRNRELSHQSHARQRIANNEQRHHRKEARDAIAKNTDKFVVTFDPSGTWQVGGVFTGKEVKQMEISRYLAKGMKFRKLESGKGIYEYEVGQDRLLKKGVLVISTKKDPTPTPPPDLSPESA